MMSNLKKKHVLDNDQDKQKHGTKQHSNNRRQESICAYIGAIDYKIPKNEQAVG